MKDLEKNTPRAASSQPAVLKESIQSILFLTFPDVSEQDNRIGKPGIELYGLQVTYIGLRRNMQRDAHAYAVSSTENPPAERLRIFNFNCSTPK